MYLIVICDCIILIMHVVTDLHIDQCLYLTVSIVQEIPQKHHCHCQQLEMLAVHFCKIKSFFRYKNCMRKLNYILFYNRLVGGIICHLLFKVS